MLGGRAIAPAFGDFNSTPPTLDVPLLTIPNIAQMTVTTCVFDPNFSQGFEIVTITNLASGKLDISLGDHNGVAIPLGGSYNFESVDTPPNGSSAPLVQTWQFLLEDLSDSHFATVFLTGVVRGTNGCVTSAHAIAQ